MIYVFPLLLSLLQPAPPFRSQTIDSNVAIGYGLAIGDVDGDGKPDILLADQKQFVWYRNGDWKKFVLTENLTAHDNVCIAARDLDGDGKVEVAVGAQWNPGETANKETSGSVHYLVAPPDRTKPWQAVPLYHEPTIHRMRWVRSGDGRFYLTVLPLHGRNNAGGAGAGVRLLLYRYPDLITKTAPYDTVQTGMHLTHNFAVPDDGLFQSSMLAVAGKEGIRFFQWNVGRLSAVLPTQLPPVSNSSGEVKVAKAFIATIEPMHGTKVVVYPQANPTQSIVLDSNVREGHALATADFLGRGNDQVVAGWRVPNSEGKVGIKLYTPNDTMGTAWTAEWIDEDGMACEDLQVADLNGDGKLDIVASGRATHNLKIYWNGSSR